MNIQQNAQSIINIIDELPIREESDERIRVYAIEIVEQIEGKNGVSGADDLKRFYESEGSL